MSKFENGAETFAQYLQIEIAFWQSVSKASQPQMAQFVIDNAPSHVTNLKAALADTK